MNSAIPKNGVLYYNVVNKAVTQCFFLFFLFLSSSLKGNSVKEFKVSDGFKYFSTGKHMTYLIDATKLLTIEKIPKIKNEDFNLIYEDIFSLNKAQCAFWFKLEIINESTENQLFMLECQNPDVNNIDVYQADDSGFILSEFEKHGDYYPFCDREKHYHNFAFPFFHPINEKLTYYIRIDYNDEPVVLPLYFWDFNEFYKNATNKSFVYGLYFAVLFIVAVFMLILWFFSKSSESFFYTLFIIFATLFLMANSGYSYQYLYPQFPSIRNIDQPFFAGVMTLMFIFFSKFFLELKSSFSKLNNFFNWLAFILGIEVVFMYFFMNDFVGAKDLFQFIYVFSLLLTFLIVLLSSILLLINKAEVKYKLFLIAYSVELLGFTVFALALYDVIPFNNFSRYLMYYTILFEISIFTVYLTRKMIKIKRDYLSVTLELSQQKQRALNGIMQGEIKERKRLSNELYDGLGLQLSTIKARLSAIEVSNESEKNKLNSILNDVDQACNNIRIISHNLSPYKIEEQGLKVVLEDLFHQLNQAYDIEFKLNYCLEENEKLPASIEINLYRGIKELLQNIVKHSEAKKASLIIEKNDEEEYFIQLKDNGKGFDVTDESKWGIGLKNIRSRVDYFYGDFTVNSNPGYGTLITIKFKL